MRSSFLRSTRCWHYLGHHTARGKTLTFQHRCWSLPSKNEDLAGNKPSDMLLTPSSYEYILSQTPESKALRRLRERTAEEWPNASRMQVSPDQGNFLSWLVSTIGPRKALEIGVFTGYSAICIAQGLPEDGCLVGIEHDVRPLELAKQAFLEADVDSKIALEVGEAKSVLDKMANSPSTPSYEFAFVDADKRGYPTYHELLLKIMKPGGVIVYDNMLWYGAVANHQDMTKRTVALRKFSSMLRHDKRVAYSLVPIGDGMGFCRILAT